MPTAKKRINITLEDEVYTALVELSERRAKSISSVSLSLIEAALNGRKTGTFQIVRISAWNGKKNESPMPRPGSELPR